MDQPGGNLWEMRENRVMNELNPAKKTSQNKAFWKAHRTAKRKSLYAAQFGLTDRNKKRKLRRHIRDNPQDLKAIQRYEQTMGKASDLGVSGRAARRLMRNAQLPGPCKVV